MTAPLVNPSLPPIRFGVKPYREFCRSFEQALTELEARYPVRSSRKLTIAGRNQRLRRKPK